MSFKTTLLSAGSALILSAGAAAAAPAVTESSVNLRAGPGTQYQVVGTIPGGATVDVRDCPGSWCRVNFNGETGYVSRNYLQLAGGAAPGGVVAAAPGYVYEDAPVYDDYDYGYAYGPGVGFYAGPSYRYRYGWRGQHRWDGNRVGTWQGRPGWNGNRTGNWQGRTGWQGGGNRMGNIGPGRGMGAPRVSAPVGMRGGGAAMGGGMRGGGAAMGGGMRGGGAAIGGGAGAGGPRR